MDKQEVILRFDKVDFHYDEKKPILHGVDFGVRQNSKITIMGQNGAGKSTLFKLITGELKPVKGQIHLKQGTTIGVGKQMVPTEYLENTILEYFKTLHWDNEFKIERDVRDILDLVNLNVDINKKIKDLSGGQKARMLLAFALVQSPDLLLLDEPTNNLDSTGIEHLTTFLTYYPKTVIVISHDAEFLNSFTDGVLNLDVQTQKVDQFVGNYYDVVEQLAGQVERERLMNARLKKDIRNKYEKINKLGGKSVQLRKVANRLREEAEEGKESLVDIRREDRTLRSFEIPYQHIPRPVLVKIDAVTFLNDGDETTKKVDIELHRGDKLLISGPNGAGKTTLLKTLLEHKSADVTIEKDIRIGYYSQDFSELDFDQTAMDALLAVMDEPNTQTAFDISAKFLIPSSVLNNEIRSLSEGQKGLLCYARFVLLQPAVLIMDEPTNHINFRHIPVIAEALSEFKGALILVSHDQAFLADMEIDQELSLTV